MKKLIIGLAAIMMLMSLSVQGQTSQQILSRAEKKAIRAQEKAAKTEAMIQAIKERRFAIEAYLLEDRYGRTIQVSPVTNFVAVDSLEATIQFALPNRIGGPNGLGGITDEGWVRSIKLPAKLPKYGISFEMDISGPVFGVSRIYVDVNAEGLATMRFSGAFGARFSMRGHFESLENSNLYKGVTTF